jgi:hypothetical protein
MQYLQINYNNTYNLCSYFVLIKIHSEKKLQIVTVEFADDLGSCLRNENPKKWWPRERM